MLMKTRHNSSLKVAGLLNQLSAAVALTFLVSTTAIGQGSTAHQGGLQTMDMGLSPLFNLALQNSPAILQRQADQQQAYYGLQQAESELGAQVMLNSELSYSVMSEKRFARTANQLVATYSLYQPHQQDNREAAKYQFLAQQKGIVEQQQQVVMQVASLYIDYWQQQENLRYLQKEKSSINNIIKQLQQRFQVGLQDLNDIAEIRSRLDFNEAELLKAQADLQRTRAALLAQLGLQSLRELKIYLAQHKRSELLTHAADQGDKIALFDVDKLKAELLALNSAQSDINSDQFWWQLVQSHPALQGLTAKTNASYQQEKAIENLYGPQVEAFGALVYNDSDKNFYDDMRGARAGIRLNVPLYLSGKSESSIAKQRQQSLSIKAQKRQVALRLQSQAYNAWIGIQSGKSRYQALQQALVSSQQALQASEQALKTGRRNVLDLLDAQRHLHRIQRDLPQLKAQIWLNYYQLLWSLGRLA
ncbi:TolC family protein [Thiomicrorhabdus sediminis]|uniref:TolC family protein n=1 Tax=Thiomicrorhabdus sediminis TaxID=2580412 RepID=A0A4P9K676_9GAMM|nr:TolC family protein [Thiomicrorhabdus sediminis]QCU89806.1 TolC family protein [Thiomicrorhabdus sediminis]